MVSYTQFARAVKVDQACRTFFLLPLEGSSLASSTEDLFKVQSAAGLGGGGLAGAPASSGGVDEDGAVLSAFVGDQTTHAHGSVNAGGAEAALSVAAAVGFVDEAEFVDLGPNGRGSASAGADGTGGVGPVETPGSPGRRASFGSSLAP